MENVWTCKIGDDIVELAHGRRIEATVWRARYEAAEGDAERYRDALQRILNRTGQNPYHFANEAHEIALQALCAPHCWKVQLMQRNGSWYDHPKAPLSWVGHRPSVRAVCEQCGTVTSDPVVEP